MIMETRLILASGSPRRKEILQSLGLSFEILTAEVDEEVDAGLSPGEAVAVLAERKCLAVAKKLGFPENALIIAADTLVFKDGKPFGKPGTAERASEMLRALSGATHSVFTGLSLCCGNVCSSGFNRTDITFRNMTDEEISLYVSTGEPLDKAGAYGIQGRGSVFVSSISGDYHATVGLSVCSLFTMSKSVFGIDLSMMSFSGNKHTKK